MLSCSTHPVPLFDADTFRQRHFDASVNWTKLFLPTFDRFMIHRIEDYKEFIRFPLPPHRKSIYDFIYLTSGHTTRSKGLDQYDVGAYTFFFLPAYQITTNQTVSDNARGFYCHFEPDLLAGDRDGRGRLEGFPFLQLTRSPLLTVGQGTASLVQFLLERLLDEYQQTRPERMPLIQLYLLTLFTELKRFSTSGETGSLTAAQRITQAFKHALTEQIYERQQVADYADLLAISPNHLNKCVRATLGVTAHQLIEDMLLLETKVLLRQTGLTVGEIAYKLNQNDPSDFGRFFKRKTGYTLTQYRLMD